MKNKLLEAAITLNESGFKVIPTNDPTRPDGKKPLVSWKKFQAGQTKQELINCFKGPKFGGIALLTGAGKETIEVAKPKPCRILVEGTRLREVAHRRVVPLAECGR